MIELNPNQNDPNTVANPVNLQGTDQTMSVPSQATAESRASQATFSLGTLMDKPYEDWYTSILGGMEKPVRKEAATAIDARKSQDRQQMIMNTVAQSPNAFTLAKDQQFMSQVTGIPAPTDPNSVIEQYTASEYLRPMWSFTDLSMKFPGFGLDKATVPGIAEDAINHGITNQTIRNQISTRVQKSLDNYNKQSYVGWGVDQLKNLSQIYDELKLRGTDGDYSDLLGTALEQFRFGFYSNPDWPRFEAIMNQLDNDNPSMAMVFGAAMIGQSNRDIQLNNLTTILGLPSDLVAAGGMTMLSISAANRVRAAVQSVVRSSGLTDEYLARLSSIDKQVKTPTDIPVEPHSSPQQLKIAQAAGHGDNTEAAVQGLAKDINDKFNYKVNPLEQEVKSFPELFKTDISHLNNDAPIGNEGAEMKTRAIQLAELRGIEFRSAVQDIAKTQRTPIIVASEELAKALELQARNKYSGINSTVTGVGRVLIWDPASNTYHISIDIGDHNANSFKDEAQAVSHAEMYGHPLQQPETTVRRYWDDTITALNFEVEHLKGQIKEFDQKYTKQQFKPPEYYTLSKRLKDLNQQKKMAWANRAGAFWRPDQPMAEKLGKITLERQGMGWYLQGWVPVDETSHAFRDLLLKIPGSWSGPVRVAERKGVMPPYLFDPVTGVQTNRLMDTVKVFYDSFSGVVSKGESRFLHGVRKPDETLSPEENAQRKITTFGPKKLADRLFLEDSQIVKALPRKYIEDFKRVLESSQTMQDPWTKESGYFFRSVSELQHFYNSFIGRLPSHEEMDAFFAHSRMYETERALRILATMRNKWRLGVESHSIGMGNQVSPWFDGVKQPPGKLPGPGSGTIYFNIRGKEYWKAPGSYTKEEKENLEKGTWPLVEMYNREDMPLHKVSMKLPKTSKPRWVVSDHLSTKPIDPNDQVPRRGGGHWIFPYSHYMKQASTYFDPVSKHWIYEGDVTAFPFQNVGLGRSVANKFTEIQNLIREGYLDEARDFARTLGIAGLDYDKDILAKFLPQGKNPPVWNLHEPFRLIPTDKTIIGLDNELENRYKELGGLNDTTRSGNMARNNLVEFTGERDSHNLHTIEDMGGPKNPIYQYKPAQMLDPLDTISRSITRISNQMFLDDMKFFSSEHWFQTYKPWLDLEKGGSPFAHFAKPTWKDGTPLNIRLQAMAARKKSMDFISMPNPIQTAWKSVTEDLYAEIYNKAGGRVSEWLLPLVKVPSEKNPLRALNSLTSDLVIGLGSVKQFFTQGSAFVNLAAYEPRHAANATQSMLLHQYLRFMPEHIDFIDQKASGMILDKIPGAYTFQPGQFKQAWTVLTRGTSYEQIGHEHTYYEYGLRDRYMPEVSDRIRYWASTPFREGAGAIRVSSWYAAAGKWFEQHPGEALTLHNREAISWIINHASLLDHDMNRSSLSALNTGSMSTITKFLTYSMNLGSNLLGKRITPAQKLRWFGTNWMLFGLPGGVLTSLGLGELYREYAIKQGYVPGKDYWTYINEGLPAALLAHITGEVYDISKWGPGGWGEVMGRFGKTKTFWDMLGFMPAFLHNTVAAMDPLWGDMMALLHRDIAKFNPHIEDIIDPLRGWTAFSDFIAMKDALKTGTWFSKNNKPMLNNVSAMEAIAMFLTGLRPVEGSSQLGPELDILNQREDLRKTVTTTIEREWNLALKYRKDNPTETDEQSGYDTAMRRIKGELEKLPEKEAAEVWRTTFERAQSDQTLIEGINWSLGTSPAATPEDLERYKNWLNEQDRKKR